MQYEILSQEDSLPTVLASNFIHEEIIISEVGRPHEDQRSRVEADDRYKYLRTTSWWDFLMVKYDLNRTGIG